MPTSSLHRRRLFQLMAVAVVAPGLGASAPSAGAQAIGRVLAMSDLHSAYERTGQLLAALEAEIAGSDVPHLIAIDGDIFEHGNVVSVRSGGAIDWAFLGELPKLAPTVVNLGNHDNDLTPDLHEVVARMRSLGVLVVSNIVDARTGQPYAEAAVTVPLGRRSLIIVGAGTDSLNTYPKVSRDWLSIPEPGDWAQANLARLLDGADLMLVMSHAGVAGDRDILPLLPEGALMIGGHNHLLFQHEQGRSAYAHTGSWSNAYTTATLFDDGRITVGSTAVDREAAPSARIADLIATTLATHLTDEERAVLGVSPRAMSLGETGRAVAAALARAADAEAGFIGHTTLGTGLPAGPVTRYEFDAVVRFDGKLMVAEVPVERLAGFMARANQDRTMPLAERNGDFVYGAVSDVAGRATIRLVTTDWCALNQAEYFGVSDLVFSEVPQVRVKAAAAEGLLTA
ncbi:MULTISPECIES: metallophosphoesterase [unclassified Brevundimonas]|uniref:metallophosphoesterase n=1 Tax=unclassified Brevundimonas TaxID=2622653 RepID=UPI0025B84F42|nr:MULTISPECIES: metallophosphoesterase [unclassified Brevundimonas]